MNMIKKHCFGAESWGGTTTAVVRSRQLHIYRHGKKVLVLAGKSAPKIVRQDKICEILVM